MDAYFIPVIKFLLIYYYFLFRRTSYKGGRNWDNFDTLGSRQINTRERYKCIFMVKEIEMIHFEYFNFSLYFSTLLSLQLSEAYPK